MTSAALRALQTALDDGVFQRAYLFHGDNDYIKEENVCAIIERATPQSTRAFNLDLRQGATLDAGDLASTLDALPVMADRRVVVIRDVTTLRKDARVALEQYLERPSPHTVLILVAGAAAKPERLLIERVTAVEFLSPTPNELMSWVQQRVTASGSAIGPSATELLCGAVGSDLAVAAREIDKLLNFTNGQEIDVPAVQAVVGVLQGETLDTLLDSIGKRDGTDTPALVMHVLGQPKASGVYTVMAVATQMLALGWAASRRPASPRLERELYDLLAENRSAVVGRPWNAAVKAWARVARSWDDTAVDHAIDLLLAADVAFKEARISSDEQLLSSLVFSLTARAPARAPDVQRHPRVPAPSLP